MDFDKFLQDNNNKFVEVEDPSNPNQCFDLAFAWTDKLGIPRNAIRHLLAYQIYTQPNDDTVSHFYIIPNTTNGVPLKGDIVVWAKEYNGTAGHVGIATGKADINTFECFEQNDPIKTNSHLRIYNYTNVKGWLRAKKLITTSNAELDKLRAERDSNWNMYQQALDRINKAKIALG